MYFVLSAFFLPTGAMAYVGINNIFINKKNQFSLNLLDSSFTKSDSMVRFTGNIAREHMLVEIKRAAYLRCTVSYSGQTVCLLMCSYEDIEFPAFLPNLVRHIKGVLLCFFTF